ncbi:MAG: MATE family efflux transporter [Alphaproteobacteria bacterium]
MAVDTNRPGTSGGARFLTGTIMHHICVMTGASAVGLMALFLVDLVDMYFISLLGETELAAAIGYAGTILFFTTSISIGTAISCGALVSRRIGAGRRAAARGMAIDNFVFGAGLTAGFAVLIWFWLPELLSLLGARGRTLDLALAYLRIIVPSMPVLALAMMAGTVLRALGDPKRAMYATLIGGLVNAVLDPLLIFTAGLGIEGAAWASVVARLAIVLAGMYAVLTIHKFTARLNFGRMVRHMAVIAAIAIPAILTNIATPVGNAYVTAAIAPYGDGYMAGWSIIGRIMPVAFGVIFALSGAIGPIFGQNLGGRHYDRVRRTFTDALIFTAIFVLGVSVVLWLLLNPIIQVFDAKADAAELLVLFCTWIAASFVFTGGLYVANTAFNNVGRPGFSTLFNWGRATIGTVPFVVLGAQMGGATGILVGHTAGALIFGTLAVVVGYRVLGRLGRPDSQVAAWEVG